MALISQALGPTEIQIMIIAWASSEPLTVRNVRRQLADDRAHTTVMTTMERLADKGVLSRTGKQLRGSAYRYSAAISRGALLAGAVAQLVAQLSADPSDRVEALALLA